MFKIAARGCVLLAVGLSMIWGGGQGLTTWYKHPQPLVMDCAQFLETRPEALWLRLRDCELDVRRHSRLGPLNKHIFIPVRAPGSGDDGPLYMVLQTRDRETLRLATRVAGDKVLDSLETLEYESRVVVNPRRDVEGLLQVGIDESVSDRGRLARRDPRLAEGFLILDESERPFFWRSFIFFLLGLFLAGFMPLWTARKSGRQRRFNRLKKDVRQRYPEGGGID